jgi:hypothetical protein
MKSDLKILSEYMKKEYHNLIFIPFVFNLIFKKSKIKN